MNDSQTDLLPSCGSHGSQNSPPRRRSWALWAVCAVLTVWLIAAAVQFQLITMRAARTSSALALGEGGAATAADEQSPEKTHKGAIGRWRKAVRGLWEGDNIYLTVRQKSPGSVAMHPNMPFVVILLTPFAYLPVWAMALVFNLLKLAVIAAAVLLCARMSGGGKAGLLPWVVVAAVVWSVKPIVTDIQHGNTNVFVLGALVAHLWWHRRGWDQAAGAILALAVCLKLTPALFLVYWLYQRNWKLLAGAAVAMAVFVLAVPPLLLGASHAATLTETWWNNLIVPGLIKASWYPIHVNQSISGVVGRYFLDGPGGDIFWGPDDNPYAFQREHGWITLIALPEVGARLVVRLLQLAVLAGTAWAIGWRKLPRDDAGRMLHYGLVVLGMLLLNQRTWEHHAAVVLIASFGIWGAIASEGVTPAARRWAVALATAGLAVLWLNAGELPVALARLTGHSTQTGKDWADRLEAYGPTFCCFVLLFLAALVLAKSAKAAQPSCRQNARSSPREGTAAGTT